MPKSYELVSDIPESLLEHYLKQEAIAVDTELHGLTLHRDEVCLIQLCDDEQNVCLVQPDEKREAPNLKKLLEASNVIKVFHYALTDVAFLEVSMGVHVSPFRCTKVMSKLIRTYTDSHGLKALSKELLGIEVEKEQQQTNWASRDLSPQQLEYAANDVLHLLKIYRKLEQMIENRAPLSRGGDVVKLNESSQAMLPGLIQLLIHGYGDLDRGWQTTLFTH